VSVSVHYREILESAAAALLFALAFLVGNRIHPLRTLFPDRRDIISFSAGMAAAYVFVRVMPELAGVRVALVESASVTLRYEGMAIYFVALAGFLLFYALEHLSSPIRAASEPENNESAFRLHVGGFSAYVLLMAYLLVNNLEESATVPVWYTLAVFVHFLAIDHHLQREHGKSYEGRGRYMLAGMCLFGWALGLLVAVPRGITALLLAFLSGGIIMNSLVMELPKDKGGRFVPFMAGGIVYGAMLVPAG
jgi:hypothetical protein